MSDTEPYDYTEGATAIEINQVVSARRQRRDSQVGSAYDDDGSNAIFGGPSASIVPSSVTTMHHERPGGWRRRSSRRSMDEGASGRRMSTSRRHSGDSIISRGRQLSGERSGDEYEQPVSDYSDAGSDGEAEGASRSMVSGTSRSKNKKRLQVSPPESPRLGRSMFDNIANLFGNAAAATPTRPGPGSRRTSISSRGTRGSRRTRAEESEGEERWGYSSNEEDEGSEHSAGAEQSSIQEEFLGSDYGSVPPSPTASLPLLTGHNDPFFGDSRIDMGTPRSLSPSPAPGPPSRQSIYLADEDTTIKFTGYEVSTWRQWMWWTCSVLTCGILGLAGHWSPSLWLRWVATEKAFKLMKKGLVVVETQHREIFIHDIQIVDYPYELSTAFTCSPKSATPALGSSTPASIRNDSAIYLSNGSGRNGSIMSHSSSALLSFLKFVEYRHSRYVLDPRSGLWTMVRDWRDPNWTSTATVKDGPTEDERQQRKTLFGDNMIDIKGKSVLTLLVEEVLHPFYVFQIASIILWSLDDYYYYAFCIALISTMSICTTLIETKKTIERLREMSKFSCPVSVLNQGEWKNIDSSELVPGDVVDLLSPPLSIFPADMLVLSGDAIVNESMLTGESVPVSKSPVNDEHLVKWKEGKDIDADFAKGLLYAGTKVVRIRGDVLPTGHGSATSPQALALVIRTSFNTTKGSLVRSMLFPKPMGFKFYRDSLRFIAFLAGLAGVGFLASAVQFVELGVKWHTILLRALDLITVVVPPALPATLSIGTSFAIGRLRKHKIFCISPNRVNVGGKVNVICFDKTGTLTEDGLDVLGVRALDRQSDRFGELMTDVDDLPLGVGKATFSYALATCHSLKVIDGEIMGDPLDVKMFEFTKWTLEEGAIGVPSRRENSRVGSDRPTALVQTIVRPPGSGKFRLEDALKSGSRHAHFLELGVIRTFEFVSALRRMSVIVKRLKSTSMEIYVKGAPEVMTEICAKDSFPRDYDDLLSYYTKHGYRVIAIAGKSVEGLSWLKAQRMKREAAESDLRFLGLIIFENKLKPGTTTAIQTLRAAHLACRMVTGDNPRTAVSVARECGLVSQSAHVFYPVFLEGNASTLRSKLEWYSVDDESLKLDDYSLKPLPPPPHHTVDSSEILYQDYTLVVSGDVFRWMVNHAALETLQRMLVKAQVYARMSPDEKHELVERLQSLGYIVAFCGDGANDCGALKAADVGLSLSEAEASVAAPFTSQNPDIGCMIEVIKEGRAALVTSFSCFKYMALYSLIQFTTITLLYSFASSLGDFQFLYIDLFIIIPIAVFMGRTHPFPRIHTQSPTASLVSKKVLSSIIGQVLVTSGFQFWAFSWTKRQSWYRPPVQDSGSDKLETTNYENTVLFLVSSFQYILVAAVFSIGPPYRKSIWTNWLLMTAIITLLVFSTIILLSPPQALSVILELMDIPTDAKQTLLGVVMLNVVICSLLERWNIFARAVTTMHRWWRQRRPRRRVRDGKVYKAVEGGMRTQ